MAALSRFRRLVRKTGAALGGTSVALGRGSRASVRAAMSRAKTALQGFLPLTPKIWGATVNHVLDGSGKEVQMKWPFKRLSAKSGWPLQGLVVQMAAPMRHPQCPADAIEPAAWKQAERLFRAGARLAWEFGLDPVKLLDVARKQIVREMPGALDAFAAAKEEQLVNEVAAAEALKIQFKDFGNGSGEN